MATRLVIRPLAAEPLGSCPMLSGPRRLLAVDVREGRETPSSPIAALRAVAVYQGRHGLTRLGRCDHAIRRPSGPENAEPGSDGATT